MAQKTITLVPGDSLVVMTAAAVATTGDVVGIRLQSTAATPASYITFGHVFRVGVVRPTDSLAARFGTNNLFVQMDVKATHADGSVRHAVLTLLAPAVPAGGAVELMLAKGTATAPSPVAPSLAALMASGYNTTVVFTGGITESTVVGTGGTVGPSSVNWLSGLAVNEFYIETTVAGGKLKVGFSIRAYADGTTTTDVIFDNSWMFSPGKTDLNYGVSISQRGVVAFAATGINHYLYSTWHHEIAAPGPNIQFDIPNLLEAAALPNYDLTKGVSDAAIQANFVALTPANTAPLGTAIIATYMPGAGGRQDIGPQPNWTAHWILSQNATARAVMMACADAAGGVPWHYLDEATGKPVNRDTYKTFMALPDVAGKPEYLQPVNGFPAYGSAADPWSADAAHMPDLTYVPYLITGSYYRFREMQAQGAFAIFQANPYYEYYADGATTDPLNPGIALYAGQAVGVAREMAWAIRQVAEAAYITPDGDPLKAYFTSQLNGTMHGLVQHYITDNASAVFGQIKGFITDGSAVITDTGMIPPWQQGYLVTALAAAAKTGILPASNDAARVMGYMVPFLAGLYLNGANGYHPFNGPAYHLYICDTMTLAPFTTWAQLQTENVRLFPLNTSGWGIPMANPGSFPDSARDMDSGYPIIAKAALADLITHTGLPIATQARDYVTAQITGVWAGAGGPAAELEAWRVDPEWSIIPK